MHSHRHHRQVGRERMNFSAARDSVYDQQARAKREVERLREKLATATNPKRIRRLNIELGAAMAESARLGVKWGDPKHS